MKKLLMIMVCVLLVGCGAEASNSVTLESAVKAFEDSGAELDDGKPWFSLLGAVDGVMLTKDLQPVKVYEFDNAKAIKDAQEVLPRTIINGLLLLETSHEESIEIFNSLK